MNDQPDTRHPILDTLAELIRRLRPDWDRPGILTALDTARLRVGVTPADLAIAAIKAASNDKNRTPAVIPLDGDHWREHVRPPATPAPPKRCNHCHEFHNPAAGCITRTDGDHSETAERQLAEVRAKFYAATAQLCPHGVRWRHCHRHDGHVVAGEVIEEETG